jgi:hypothetical protein
MSTVHGKSVHVLSAGIWHAAGIVVEAVTVLVVVVLVGLLVVVLVVDVIVVFVLVTVLDVLRVVVDTVVVEVEQKSQRTGQYGLNKTIPRGPSHTAGSVPQPTGSATPLHVSVDVEVLVLVLVLVVVLVVKQSTVVTCETTLSKAAASTWTELQKSTVEVPFGPIKSIAACRSAPTCAFKVA